MAGKMLRHVDRFMLSEVVTLLSIVCHIQIFNMNNAQPMLQCHAQAEFSACAPLMDAW